ncbi:MAG: redoxin domain-containing protein [Pyrinomonadaceae bacterium]|nr:redoxin domain-containing protein [Acidobacteriota bacterium]MBP7375222.1 redoxin domain-containing protein [Pyrinomonadaceae bacterium]
MELALLIFKLFLAAVFALAGFAKLADLAGSRKAVADFGVPSPFVGFVGVALPAIEIAVAVSLLFAISSWYGAIGAVVLLTIFIAGMIYQIAKGNAPDCHCFGQIHSEPVGISSLIRNIIFLVPAVIIISKGPAGQGMSVTSIDRDSLQLILVIAAVFLLGIAVEFLRRISKGQDEIAKRIDLLELVAKNGGQVERETAGHPHDGLPIGAILPDFEISDIDGNPTTTRSLVSGDVPLLLFFVSPSCSPCKALVPKFQEWAEELSGRVKVVLISSGTVEDNVDKFGGQITRALFIGKERDFAESVNAKWTPSALFVDTNSRISSHVAAGDSAIIELVEKIRTADLRDKFLHFTVGNGSGRHSHVDLGSQIPEFTIDAIDGSKIKSSEMPGKRTLITFWSTTCPHCDRMAPDLREWDLARTPDDPALILFSDGEKEPHTKLGFRAPIVLDKGNKLSAKLGMFGTPSAILIDEEGRFASEIAVGAPQIWSLIGKTK